MSIGVIVHIALTVGPGFCFLIVDLGDWNKLMILYYFWVIIYLVIFIKVVYFLFRKFIFTQHFAYKGYKKSSDIPVLNIPNDLSSLQFTWH